MNPVRSLSRPLLASMFVYGAVDTLRDPEPKAKLAAPVLDKVTEMAPSLPLERVQIVQLNAAVQLGAAGMLATGRWPRLSALVLAGSLVPTTMAGHRFWAEDDPQRARQQRAHFFKNLSMLGGLLAAVAQPAGPRRKRKARRAARAAKAKASS
jgi:putative oxidoreductase